MLREGVYEERQPDEHGALKSEVFPGLWLPPDALLSGEMPQTLEVLQQGIASQEHKTFTAALTRRRKEAK